MSTTHHQRWHVLTLDRYIAGPFETRNAAIEACHWHTLDPRKRRYAKRHSDEFSTYYGPKRHSRDGGYEHVELWIMTTAEAQRHGFNITTFPQADHAADPTINEHRRHAHITQLDTALAASMTVRGALCSDASSDPFAQEVNELLNAAERKLARAITVLKRAGTETIRTSR